MEVAISRDIRGGEETHRQEESPIFNSAANNNSSPNQVDRLFSSVSSPSRTIPRTRCDDSATTTEEVLSTSSSVRAPTSTPDTTAVSSRSSSVELQTPQSMFKKYRTLPFVKSTAIRIYPDATGQITPAHWGRFHEIARMFQKAVEEHETLRHHAQGVGYLLKQCGTSPSKSCPSIVVTCTKEVCRALGKLLVRPDLKEQYDPPSPQRRRKLFNSQQKSHPTQDKPRFQIYLWIQEGPLPFTLLWRRRVAEGLRIQRLHDTDILPWSDLTMCSSRVTYSDGSCTTLSCLLEVDSRVYGLTVGHAFAHLAKDPQGTDDTTADASHSPKMLNEDQSSPAVEHFHFTVNDVEYEISEDDSTPRAPATPRPTSAPNGSDSNDGLLRTFEGELNSAALHLFTEQESTNTPDLDWALVELSDEMSAKPNFYLCSDDPQEPIILRDVAQHKPESEAEVVILRSLQNPVRGTLLRGSSYIGGINRPGHAEVWNISFTGPDGLQKGDSGSLVVDLITHEVYGYVVGLNPFGEAYIMPMGAALDQIKEASNAHSVSLRNPVTALKDMVDWFIFDSTKSRAVSMLEQAIGQSSSIRPFESFEPKPEPASKKPLESLQMSAGALDSASKRVHRAHDGGQPSFFSKALVMPQEEIIAFEETEPDIWERHSSAWDSGALDQRTASNFVVFLPEESKIAGYGSRFDETFRQIIKQDTNGAFDCKYDFMDGHVYPKVTWACFKIKTVNSPTDYDWQQPCIYVEWDCKTGRQLVFISSLRNSWVSSFLDNIPDHEKRRVNPFAWHHAFAKEVLQIYDSAYWNLRDIVRAEEKRNRDELQNKADGRLPHDISRHLYHYQETIEVADNTLQALLTAQERWRQESPRQVLHVLPSWLDTYSGLHFEKNRVFSLICRIKGLADRHINQINMSFNLISERSSRASSSGNPMKAVLTLCLVYLPGIFVSTLFSTSFFSNQSDMFTISSSFWVYWVIAIPLTLVTFLLWATANPANVLRNIAGVKGTVQTKDSPTVLDREKQAISKLQTPLKGLGWRRSTVGGHEPV